MLTDDESLRRMREVTLVLKMLVFVGNMCDIRVHDTVTWKKRQQALKTYEEAHNWIEEQGLRILWDAEQERFITYSAPSKNVSTSVQEEQSMS